MTKSLEEILAVLNCLRRCRRLAALIVIVLMRLFHLRSSRIMAPRTFAESFQKNQPLSPEKYSRHAQYYKMLLLLRSLNKRTLGTRLKKRELCHSNACSSGRSILSQPWARGSCQSLSIIERMIIWWYSESLPRLKENSTPLLISVPNNIKKTWECINQLIN